MRQILLIRHGATKGNLEHRYVGTTDENLHPEGRRYLDGMREVFHALCNENMPAIYVSPMRRARQSAEILFPGVPVYVMEEFAECGFGEFEYKSYAELNGNADYQRYIDSGGEIAFPGGESKAEFTARVMRGFERIRHENAHSAQTGTGVLRTVVILAHGGTIMALLDRLSDPHGDYFSWQTKPGCGYLGLWDENSRISRVTPV